MPLARRIGSARRYYDVEQAVARIHAAGLYLIGRVVTFEDPVLSENQPALAIHNSDGTIWHNNAGLGWTNPYDRRVWAYNVTVAVAAAKAGFDEIQFDYVRFPSDGDLSLIRYPGTHPQPMRWTIPAFVQYAASRLHPLGARVSVDVFGLSDEHLHLFELRHRRNVWRQLGIGRIHQRRTGRRSVVRHLRTRFDGRLQRREPSGRRLIRRELPQSSAVPQRHQHHAMRRERDGGLPEQQPIFREGRLEEARR